MSIAHPPYKTNRDDEFAVACAAGGVTSVVVGDLGDVGHDEGEVGAEAH